MADYKMDADPPVGAPASAPTPRSASPVSQEILGAMLGPQFEHMFKEVVNH